MFFTYCFMNIIYKDIKINNLCKFIINYQSIIYVYYRLLLVERMNNHAFYIYLFIENIWLLLSFPISLFYNASRMIINAIFSHIFHIIIISLYLILLLIFYIYLFIIIYIISIFLFRDISHIFLILIELLIETELLIEKTNDI